VAAAVASALVAGAAVWFAPRPSPSTAVTRFITMLPEGTRFSGAAKGSAISPDGRRLVLLAVEPGAPVTLWVQSLDSLTAVKLAGTEGALNPVWSPDSRKIAFFVSNEVKVVDVEGGPAQRLVTSSGGAITGVQGIAWSADGTLVVGSANEGLRQVATSGSGGVSAASTLDTDSGETNHTWPSFLPDGRHLLYVAVNRDRSKSSVYVTIPGSNDRQFVMNNDAEVVYASGHLLFLRGPVLMAQAFDPDRLELSGEAFRLVDQVARIGNGATTFSVSRTGVLTYRPIIPGVDGEVTWFDRAGRSTPVKGLASGTYASLALSRGASAIALARAEDGTNDIWVHDVARGITSRITTTPTTGESNPQWSPDGRSLVYASNRGIVRVQADGSGEEEIVGPIQSPNLRVTDWSADGRSLLFSQTGKAQDIWVLPLDGARSPRPLLGNDFSEREGRFSPDGRWVAFSSDQSGEFEVYLRSLGDVPTQIRVSNDRGVEPKWRADGRELFYLTPDGRMMSVSLQQTDGGLAVGAPEQLFDSQTAFNAPAAGGLSSRSGYDVTADGQRFLVIVTRPDVSVQSTYVIVNWPALLTR
jgi:Tol biopolymer transport system component